MIEFILNETDISTDLPPGMTVLDFVRYHKDLKGTKIGCREGDCGACTILVGELIDNEVRYRSMTSCLMPLANAAGKHIVSIEGINPTDGSLTPVQQAMVDESGTQCGFCTVGFVMSLTGFCVDSSDKTPEMAMSAIDGNICRCTGYKSIERAACRVSGLMSEPGAIATGLRGVVPEYFGDISKRLSAIQQTDRQPPTANRQLVSGGTDLYVQRHDEMAESAAMPLLYNEELRGIRDTGEHIEIGASATVTDLLESPVMNAIFPDLYKHLKLVSSTPIRNMATLAGNFTNASPIGDMTVWFLALDAEITLMPGPPMPRTQPPSAAAERPLKLRDLYQGYKQLAKQPDEIITKIKFKKPNADFRFNFEKVCKRTYLDIATVNTAISLQSEPPAVAGGLTLISNAHVSAGGVAPIPLYLKETSAFLNGKEVSEISPISDVRGTEQYKRLLLRQLFKAHFVELFATESNE
ncbi:MAG: FAD binding domain-containing protein [Acidobacteria bacterium]|nr:FAD binding domain-containing protein [Acidobacteriota bacterium]